MDDSYIYLLAQNWLAIKEPIEYRIRSKAAKGEKGLAGYCETRFRKDKISSFVIVINLETVITSGYSLRDVILHEMVHAATISHGLFKPQYHHNKVFQEICKTLRAELQNNGISVGELYNPEVDTD